MPARLRGELTDWSPNTSGCQAEQVNTLLGAERLNEEFWVKVESILKFGFDPAVKHTGRQWQDAVAFCVDASAHDIAWCIAARRTAGVNFRS
jgi:hypothetical protein